MADNHEHDGASVQEQLIEACRRNNVELLGEIISQCKSDAEITDLLNNTTTVMGNHLYHEAALRGNYEVIDLLLDQPDFECDPLTRAEGDTPLHSAVRWLNGEPAAQRPFGAALVGMMLEAGSSTRVRNKARLTPAQLVDPANPELRGIIERHEYAELNAGDFVDSSGPPPAAAAAAAKKAADGGSGKKKGAKAAAPAGSFARPPHRDHDGDDDDDDAEFSGSDEEERAEWERRRKAKGR
ncbi:hypothetical protein GGS23DRAFT_592937 [Durotheca rogersii]|uniref:uncharacterized protein n=1 Tax=Durotheca rogersii TaxID=419775 RepID=UPI002220B5F7|nr:uncharacterized protein GGS23DRAFT_592937 [Durotheca rogersii]KAI5867640.1 hypothetical protein GGS23DRAFT_592937 [Durotheca rogersii]